MKQERYYYIRDNIKSDPDGLGRPIITVCLVEDDSGNIGRGVAICSGLDQPCKRIGRGIAKTRAAFATAIQGNSCEIKREAPLWLGFEFGFYKSYFKPCLTQYERKLFRNEEA